MSNREKFPGFGEFVDEMRAVFGKVKVRHVVNRETGEELGAKHPGEYVIATGSAGSVTAQQRNAERIRLAREALQRRRHPSSVVRSE